MKLPCPWPGIYTLGGQKEIPTAMNQSVRAVILLQSLNRTCRTSVLKRYEEIRKPITLAFGSLVLCVNFAKTCWPMWL